MQKRLMGANMQRQAIPLLRPHAFVGTGMNISFLKTCSAVISDVDGIVRYVDSDVLKLNHLLRMNA